MSEARLETGCDGDQRPKGPGRPRDASKEAAILLAAQAMFLRHGFSRTSIDSIAEEAGVAKATIYARFKDKDELLRAAITAKCADFLDAAVTAATEGRTPRQGLIEFAHRFLRLVTDPDSLAMHALVMDAGKTSPQLPTMFFDCAVTPTSRRLSAFLAAETVRGRLAVDDPEGASWRFLGMVKAQDQMRALLNLPARPKGDVDRYIEGCVDMFLAAYAAK